MDEELIELGRDIGTPVIGPVSFQIGRLLILDAGQRWIMITINDRQLGCLSELLPPAEAKQFLDWITELAKAS